ncbi:PH domain-containing protein [Peribacillus frigoritolerans]|uniref:PH domain-containing protein n=1 Tax=Peribacillus frigoritolerans TaxID=450367 RepID=UPI0023D99F4E|nr:PH domain-containing protein [Peribacillus frigoritolerans]MDF1997565.1 PH domain-containing protein [Peribacillus frigoritolerans]
MMEEHAKRLHPIKIPFEFWKLLKGNVFFIIMLYVLNFGSEKMYMKVLQIGFLVYLVWKVISVILKWYTYKYQIKESTLYITSGLVSKSYRTVPLHKVQNVQQRTTLFHKIFRLTSLTFETGMTGDQGSVPFEMISRKEAERLEGEYASKQELPVIEADIPEERIAEDMEPAIEKTIHFTPSKHDVLKASFTSLSFLALSRYWLRYIIHSMILLIWRTPKGFLPSYCIHGGSLPSLLQASYVSPLPSESFPHSLNMENMKFHPITSAYISRKVYWTNPLFPFGKKKYKQSKSPNQSLKECWGWQK